MTRKIPEISIWDLNSDPKDNFINQNVLDNAGFKAYTGVNSSMPIVSQKREEKGLCLLVSMETVILHDTKQLP